MELIPMYNWATGVQVGYWSLVGRTLMDGEGGHLRIMAMGGGGGGSACGLPGVLVRWQEEPSRTGN